LTCDGFLGVLSLPGVQLRDLSLSKDKQQ